MAIGLISSFHTRNNHLHNISLSDSHLVGKTSWSVVVNASRRHDLLLATPPNVMIKIIDNWSICCWQRLQTSWSGSLITDRNQSTNAPLSLSTLTDHDVWRRCQQQIMTSGGVANNRSAIHFTNILLKMIDWRDNRHCLQPTP
jgi:hypothetical protein